MWWEQLYTTVSDTVWESYNHAQQLNLINLRAEFLVYGALPDRITPPGPGGGRFEQGVFCLPKLSSPVFMTRLLQVFENRRPLRERQMCAVGCNKVVSLDLCAHSGKALGGKWQVPPP